MDVTAFTKVMVEGPDAYAMLDRLTANRMPQKVGSITLTHMLNRAGRIELETTIVRMGEDRFYLVCAAFFEQRLLDHLATHGDGADATVTALSSSWGALALNGPRSRDILAGCTPARLDNASFRWLSAQEIEVAGPQDLGLPHVLCRGAWVGIAHALRGDAGRLHALSEAGAAHGLVDYGSFAMNVMRMEKGFKGAGELTNEVTLPEADVMRFVRTDKEYLGKAATLDGDPRWNCAYLSIEADGEIDGHGGEAVMLDGQTVGATASVVYSPTVGKHSCLCLPEARGRDTRHHAGGDHSRHADRAGRVLADPAYDPQSLLPRVDAVAEPAE
jgi:dimethylglycine dehydrogenase